MHQLNITFHVQNTRIKSPEDPLKKISTHKKKFKAKDALETYREKQKHEFKNINKA